MIPAAAQQPTGPGSQAGRTRGLTALVRLAVQIAIREELAEMAALKVPGSQQRTSQQPGAQP